MVCVFVPRYFGRSTATWCPASTSAALSAPTTSARPPVFEYGTPSEATKRIFIALAPDGEATGAVQVRQEEPCGSSAAKLLHSTSR